MAPTFLYYVDPTCETKCRQATGQSFHAYFQRAQRRASRAVDGLRDELDIDFARVFNVIMKTPKADQVLFPRSFECQQLGLNKLLVSSCKSRSEWATTLDHVLSDLRILSQFWRPTDDRRVSHVRFFCLGHSLGTSERRSCFCSPEQTVLNGPD